MTRSKKNITGYLLSLALSLLAIFHTFFNIHKQEITQWDEARHIVSALEMLTNQQWLVTTYMGHPDYWNVKPPLAVWLIALSYQLISPPLLALRLPALIATLITTYLVFLYAKRWAGFYAGLLASGFWLTAWPLFTSHAARTADPDMVFILFISAACYLLTRQAKRDFFWAYLLLGMAFLAKSFHVAPYGLAAFLYCSYLCYKRQLTLKQLLALPCVFLLPIAPWAVGRYIADGGHFFEVMLFYDVIKRSHHTIAGAADESPLLYWRVLFFSGMSVALAIAGLGLLLTRAKSFSSHQLNAPFLLAGLWIIVPFITYSIAATKLDWYIYGVFSPLAVICAVIIQQTWQILPRLGQLLVSILLALNFLTQEYMLLDYIVYGALIEDKCETALRQLSAQTLDKKAVVFMENNPSFLHPDINFYQHHYATALMLKNIQLHKGGKADFLKLPATNKAFLISVQGQIIARRDLP